MMNELEGLRFDRLPELTQSRTALPDYVPVIPNNSCRTVPLEIPFAAIPVEAVFTTKGDHLEAIAKTAAELRGRFGLAPATRIVLNCIRKDAVLERLWEYWRQDDLPGQLRPLGIDLVIGPNFSHLRGVPRMESVGNRMRHLMCIRDIRRAGLQAVPHLSVVDPPAGHGGSSSLPKTAAFDTSPLNSRLATRAAWTERTRSTVWHAFRTKSAGICT